jgi:hypothetical protein
MVAGAQDDANAFTRDDERRVKHDVARFERAVVRRAGRTHDGHRFASQRRILDTHISTSN